MTTILQPILKKKIDDAVEKIINDQVRPWVFLHSGAPVRVKRFNGKEISYHGVSYSGSPRVVFWSGYIEPFIEDLCMKQMESAVATAKERDLEVKPILIEVQEQLRSGIRKIYANMAQVDRRLRGNGYPNKVSLRPVEHEVNKMERFVDDLINAEILSRMRKVSFLRSWWARNWKFVIGAVLLPIFIAVWGTFAKTGSSISIQGDIVGGSKSVIEKQVNIVQGAKKERRIDIAKLQINRAFRDFYVSMEDLQENFIKDSERIAGEFAARGTARSGIFVTAEMNLSLETKKLLNKTMENLKRRIEDALIENNVGTSLSTVNDDFNAERDQLIKAEARLVAMNKTLNDNPKSWEMKALGEVRITKDFDVTNR